MKKLFTLRSVFQYVASAPIFLFESRLMGTLWKKSVTDQIVKRSPADVEILAGLVFAHPVIGYLGQHGDNLMFFLLRDIAVPSIYIIKYLLEQNSYGI